MAHAFMHLLRGVHPLRGTHPPWKRSRRLSLPTLWNFLWVYPLGGLWRLEVSPLTHLLPSLTETSNSFGSIFVGVLYIWLDRLIILCIVD